MNTQESAELMALRGLLLLVVEVQNIVRQVNHKTTAEDYALALGRVAHIVDGAHAAELVQLAKAALQTKPEIKNET